MWIFGKKKKEEYVDDANQEHIMSIDLLVRNIAHAGGSMLSEIEKILKENSIYDYDYFLMSNSTLAYYFSIELSLIKEILGINVYNKVKILLIGRMKIMIAEACRLSKLESKQYINHFYQIYDEAFEIAENSINEFELKNNEIVKKILLCFLDKNQITEKLIDRSFRYWDNTTGVARMFIQTVTIVG